MSGSLHPDERLALETLAARYRLGEFVWTFDADHHATLDGLADRGLVEFRSGPEPGTLLANLTSAGHRRAMHRSYRVPGGRVPVVPTPPPPLPEWDDPETIRAAATALDCLDTLVVMLDPDGVYRSVEWVDRELADIVRDLAPKCAGDAIQRRLRLIADRLDGHPDSSLPDCIHCQNDSGPLAPRLMILCPDCGNKRCPKATYHGYACTGSNEPGQPGSAY